VKAPAHRGAPRRPARPAHTRPSHDRLPHNRLPPWLRRAIYAAIAVLLSTGLAWLFVAYALAPPDVPAPAPHRWSGPLLALHGVAAHAALVLCALVGQIHLSVGWRRPEVRRRALLLVTTLLLLAVSGLGFYYAADEQLMPWFRWSHVGFGLLLPVALALHVARGRRLSRA
jgi:hypothetical protein